MAKMGEDIGKDDIEFNMDLLLNKACYLDALEVFIKSSDFIYLFFFHLGYQLHQSLLLCVLLILHYGIGIKCYFIYFHLL